MVARCGMPASQVAGLLLMYLLLQSGWPQVDATSLAQGLGPHAKASMQWRVINLKEVTYGWAVGELKLFSDTTCKNELMAPADDKTKDDLDVLSWIPISSGDNNAPVARAFDRLTWTEWRAQCYMCKEREAWLGLKFNMPVTVHCVQLYQWGVRSYKADDAMLQRWEAGPAGTNTGAWQDTLKGSDLSGETWDTVSFTRCDNIPAPDHGRVVVTNGGYFPSSASFSCSGARIMAGVDKQVCQPDGSWPETIPTCWPAIALVILIASIFTLELICFAGYYLVILRRTSPPLQSTTFIPDDSVGKFTSHELWGIAEKPEEDDISDKKKPNLFLHVLMCPCCRIAHTWHSVGKLNYFVGSWLPQLCCPFLPCIAAYLRKDMRKRFSIKGSIAYDVFLWICCIPCVATQEAKHVDHICAIAEEEALVMKQSEERKVEKEHRIRAQIEAKNAGAGGGTGILAGTKLGKDKDANEADNKAAMKQAAEMRKHPTFVTAESVMDVLDRLS